MSTATLADQSTTSVADDYTDLRRITEDDPDYQRLHAQTVARLERSLRQYIREEQRGVQGADSRFVKRHYMLMKQAYEAAHKEGQRDYWPAVSNRTVQHRYIPPDTHQTLSTLARYALGSVNKFALDVKHYVQQQKSGTLSDDVAYGQTIELYNPNHDSKGRFTYGSGGLAGSTGKAPFTMKDFQDAYVASQAASTSSINPVRHADINGEHYYFKPVEYVNTGGIRSLYGNPGDYATVRNVAEYETHAEAASSEIGKTLGFHDQVTETYDVHDAAGNHFSASKEIPDTQILANGYQAMTTGGQHQNLGAQLAISDKNLQGLVLHEYIVGDPDRHGGNYMINNAGTHIYQIDMGRSLRYNGTGLNMDSAAFEMISNRLFSPRAMIIPASTLNRIIGKENAVVRIMQEHGLSAGIPGVKARFNVLRAIAGSGDTSLYHLAMIGGIMPT